MTCSSEYPGDEEQIRQYLTRNDIDPAGKDMFGLAAIHKFASWNKINLIQLLISRLDDKEINVLGGQDKGTALHICVEMNSLAAFKYLISTKRVDLTIQDVKGRTFIDVANAHGKNHFIDAIELI